MSFTSAVDQVQQILQWEQQLADPASATQASATQASATQASAGGALGSAAAPGSGAGASTASGGASFASTLAQAQAVESQATQSLLTATASGSAASGLSSAATTGSQSSALTAGAAGGLLSGGDSQLLAALAGAPSTTGLATTGLATTGLATTGLATTTTPATMTPSTVAPAPAASSGPAATSGPAGGRASGPTDPRIEAMTQAANSLVGKPYVWGGGHAGWGPQSGYDCSGFVSAVLHAGGYLSAPQDTVTLPSAAGIVAGPGRYVTIYDRSQPGQLGHVIIQINGQFYESGGEHGSWGGGGGVEKIATPSAAYLATFNDVLHPAGL